MIESVTGKNIRQAAEVHAISWRASHRTICTEDFVALHTTDRQMDYLQKQMEQGARIYLLALSGRGIGIVSVKENIIADLYVLPQAQGRGYGTELLRFAIERCAGVPVLWALSSNTRAIRLYERNGFHLTGQRKCLSDTLAELEMRYSVC